MSAASKAVMAEFLIRWPCPAAVDEDHHLSRMLLLFRDCRDLAPGMMRKAGDFVARIPNRPTVMPSASEIMGAVESIMADRAAKQAVAQRAEAWAGGDSPRSAVPDEQPIGAVTPENTERCRAWNERLMANGATWRVTPIGAHSAARVTVVDDGTVVPTHVCDGRGGVLHRLSA